MKNSTTKPNVFRNILSKKDLMDLKNALPVGGLTRIAEKTKFSNQYVTFVLESERKITKSNLKIVNEAIRIVTELKGLEKQVSNDLKKLLAA